MKKYILTIILLILFFPLLVFAEDTDITISDLEFVSSEGYTEETTPAEIVNNQIKLDLKMNEVGDSISYKIKIKNNKNEDYIVDSTSVIQDDNYMRYTLENDEHSYLLKPGEEKEYILSAIYENQIEKEKFRAGIFTLDKDEYFNITPDSLINPKTGSFFFIILSLCIIIFTMMFLPKKQKVLSLFILIIIPLMVHAEGVYHLVVDSNIVFDYFIPNLCTYDGELVQGAEFIDGQFTYRYMQEFGTYDSSVSTYIWGNIETDGWGVKLTDPTSADPVTTTLCTSINNKPIVSMKYMFYESQTTSVDTSSFDTRNVTTINSMFLNTSNIEEIDLINFNTSQMIDIAYMFCNNPKLKELDLSSWDTSKVSSLIAIVNMNTNSLTSIDLSGWDFSSVTTTALFTNLTGGVPSSLKKINVSNSILPENCSYAFGGLYNVEEIILDGVDTSHVTNMNVMFSSCKSITSINLSSFDTSNVTNMSNMFYYCSGLTSIDVSNWDTSSVTTMNSMFSGCTGLTTLDLSSFDTSSVTNTGAMFSGCSNITTLDLSGFVFNNSSFNGIFSNMSSLKKVIAKNWVLPSSFANAIFRLCSAYNSPIEEIDVTGWDLSNTTNLSGVFGSFGSNDTGGTGLKTIIGLDTWDTSNITDMGSMFEGLSSLTEVDLSSFDMSHVTNLSNIFKGMTSLERFNTPKALIASSYTYYLPGVAVYEDDCYLKWSTLPTSVTVSLEGAYLVSDFNSKIKTIAGSADNIQEIRIAETKPTGISTTNIADSNCSFPIASWYDNGIVYLYSNGKEIFMNEYSSSMFAGLNYLHDIDIQGFHVEFVTNMSRMFYSVGSKYTGDIELDLSDFVITDRVTSAAYMFYEFGKAANSVKIIAPDWDLTNATSIARMFYSCGYNAQKLIFNVPNWNLPKVTNAEYLMYEVGYSATEVNIDANSWNFEVLQDAQNMFSRIGRNASTFILDLKDWNTSSFTNLGNMFSYTNQNSDIVTTNFKLDVTGWDTSSVTSMYSMFYYSFENVSNFTIIGFSDWNTSNVTTMSQMFYACAERTPKINLDLSNWNVSKVESFSYLFNYFGYHATEINLGDLSNWVIKEGATLSSMFYYVNYDGNANFDIGTLTIPTANLSSAFISTNLTATINLTGNPSNYSYAFSGTARNSGSVVVNYTSAVTDIDAIIATKSENSNVIKGELITT